MSNWWLEAATEKQIRAILTVARSAHKRRLITDQNDRPWPPWPESGSVSDGEILQQILQDGDVFLITGLFPFMTEQWPELCLEVVQRNGLLLQFVKEQTPQICLAAVEENPFALQHVKEQTWEICRAAALREKRRLHSLRPPSKLGVGPLLRHIRDKTLRKRLELTFGKV